MPQKYHISTKLTPPRFQPIGKYSTAEFREDCAGSCRECVKKKCIYDIFDKSHLHSIAMDNPEFLYECYSCFRCVQECTRAIFHRVINPDYKTLGDDYWTNEVITAIWGEAHTGRVPVSGAGYRGPFSGNGFDSMWTDMSEIVRPTRDGIHGREYINTGMELSRRANRLTFDEKGEVVTQKRAILEAPFPLFFQLPQKGNLSPSILKVIAATAEKLGLFFFVPVSQIREEWFAGHSSAVAPVIPADEIDKYSNLISRVKIVEITGATDWQEAARKARSLNGAVSLSLGLDQEQETLDKLADVLKAEPDMIRFSADERGNDPDGELFIKTFIEEVHSRLIDLNARHQVNLIFGGGIAKAEHLAKAVICGADAVTVDLPLLVALECRLCENCLNGEECPVDINGAPAEWAEQRMTNLIGSWRNQLIELMGAMGMREVRRLRGEKGRSMSFAELEEEVFGPLFGERKVKGYK